MTGAVLLAALLAGAQLPSDMPRPHQVAMADSIVVRPRLRMTTLRTPSAADSARGAALLESARRATAQYASIDKARAAGYRVSGQVMQGMAEMRGKGVLHATNIANALLNRSSFDPARPTALLYQPGPDGEFRLLGVMYTMPITATLDQLDAAVPLSLANWHQHINTCRPARQRGKDASRLDMKQALRHLTRAECEAAGGVFMEEGRQWMVHVNAMAADPADVWDHRGHGGGAGAGHMH